MTSEDLKVALEEVSPRPKKSEKISAHANEVGGYDDIKIQLEQVAMLIDINIDATGGLDSLKSLRGSCDMAVKISCVFKGIMLKIKDLASLGNGKSPLNAKTHLKLNYKN